MSAAPQSASFETAFERQLAQTYRERGWVQVQASDSEGLQSIRKCAVKAACDYLHCPVPQEQEHAEFLRTIAGRVSVADLNSLRLHVFGRLNAESWLRPTLFNLARPALEALVGNELAMQRRVNLSVQLPGDDSSLLPLHADSWSGDSPFEIVVWVPLVDVERTASMFVLPRPAHERLLVKGTAMSSAATVDAVFEAVKEEVEYLNARYGDIVLFDQNLAHGNRVNQEAFARWSLNCRFKGLFTPYADKRLGEFFEPITTRPVSALGMSHEFPRGFDDATNQSRDSDR